MTTPPTDKERFARVHHVFEQAYTAAAADREAVVRRLAAADTALAEEVLALLAEAATDDPIPGATPQAAPLPREIGPYRIVARLGEGGMGTVYRAEQRGSIRRPIALKVLKAGMDSAAFLRRFEAERQALAMMDHSSIARAYDAGLTDAGQPFLAMEFVKGVPITEYCDQRGLSIEARIELFIQVCAAAQHAHTKGVIHRDLKPSNILVTEQGEDPLPKIIDFGLAKAIGGGLSQATAFTEVGQILGTPEYMSPEQAGADALDLDTRTDVYSLGVVLYQLLTGTLPMSREALLRHNPVEMQRVIREADVPKPSTRVTAADAAATAASAARQTRPDGLRRALRGELDWIVMKALEKDRDRRYTTVQEFAADLRRHLDDEPVSAGPPSATYLLSKLARRYRRTLLSVAGMFAALTVGLGVALWQWADARANAERATQSATQARLAQQDAERQRQRAEASSADYRRLEDKVRLARFLTARTSLWPEGPAAVDRMQRWVAQVEAWLAAMPDHRAALEDLRREGTARDGAWYFTDPSRQFVHDALAELLADLELFTGGDGAFAEVRQSLEWSRQVANRTIDEHRQEWQEAAERVRRHQDYGGLQLAPQAGLVPLGPDPDSRLEEFWFARSGERPERGADGRLVRTEDLGIVLVLLPGGEARMGSEPDSEPGSVAAWRGKIWKIEQPLHDVALDPFFVGKYELTQAQWLQLAHHNPSKTRLEGWRRHPVETISWIEATGVLHRFGLQLPTEAQWEYACRAGTTSLWWFGDEFADLVAADGKGRMNAASGNIPDASRGTKFDDGYDCHTPVGSFEANGFGLHDVHGNVAEWTRGAVGIVNGNFTDYSGVRHAPGDGLILGPESTHATFRGGSYFRSYTDTRSAFRTMADKHSRIECVGARVCRPLDR